MKKILSMMLCISILFGISGCGNSNDTTKTDKTNKTSEMSSLEKQKNIKDLKEAIPDPSDYLENGEHIRSEDYGKENNTCVYTYMVENSPNRSDFFERYIDVCKNNGYSLNYYESLKEENDEPLNVSSFNAFLMDDDSYEVMISHYPNDDVVMIIIKHIIDDN